MADGAAGDAHWRAGIGAACPAAVVSQPSLLSAHACYFWWLWENILAMMLCIHMLQWSSISQSTLINGGIHLEFFSYSDGSNCALKAPGSDINVETALGGFLQDAMRLSRTSVAHSYYCVLWYVLSTKYTSAVGEGQGM